MTKEEQKLFDETKLAIKYGNLWQDGGKMYFVYNGTLFTLNCCYRPKMRHVHFYEIGREPEANKLKEIWGAVLDAIDPPKHWIVVTKEATDRTPETTAKFEKWQDMVLSVRAGVRILGVRYGKDSR